LLIGGALIALPAAGLSAGKLWCRMNSVSGTSLSSLSLLTSLYPGSAAVRAVGEKYLEQAGSTALAALQRIEQQHQIIRAAATGCPVATGSAIENACRDDFRSGRIHCIDGWVLAQIELDVAALCTIG